MSHTVSLDQLPMLAASGSIEAYISAANRVPMLSELEEQALARRFRDEEDLDAARQLVTSHLRLVIAMSSASTPIVACVWCRSPCTGSRPRSTNTS